MIYKKISVACFLLLVGSYFSFAWTENGEWESGSSILWDVPYQTQAYFRNWSTTCVATSGAMIINFMYAGAHISEFSGNAHPWTPITIASPYATTGQRVYSFGIYSGNDYNGSLLNYLQYYPKNGINQYYCTIAACTNANFGPLHNETIYSNTAGVALSVTSGGTTLGDVNNSLRPYLYNKHSIEALPLNGNFITLIRNALYNGPVLVSVGRNGGSHVIVVKGINSEGNFIVNDPWGSDIFNYPGNDGEGAIYEVLENGSLRAYGQIYGINSAYSVHVFDNFNRDMSHFSAWNIPIEAALKFNYNASGELDDSYNGDGDYAYIRNGFNFWNSESGGWNYYYNQGAALGFPYTTTTQGETVTAAARWTPYIPRSGRYRVLVGFFVYPANSTEVHYIVYHRDGHENLVIDQKNGTNAYEVRGNIVYKSLGNYYFNEGANENNGSVKVVNTSDVSGDINVDIVRFAYPPFPDINIKEWYYDYVLCLYDLGIISGDPDGHFRPNDQVNRAEFIKMAVMALELSKGTLYRETLPEAWNVNPDDWFRPFIEKAYAYRNYEAGSWFWEYERMAFWEPSIEPNWAEGVTRKEAARIVMNALKLEPYDSEVIGDFMFTDVGNDHPYKEYIYSIKNKDVISGYDDNSYKPDNPVNRGEASKFIFKILEYLEYFDSNENTEACQTCADKG